MFADTYTTHVRMYVCMHVCTYVCMRMYLCMHVRKCICLCLCLCLCMCIDIKAYIHMSISMCLCVCICACVLHILLDRINFMHTTMRVHVSAQRLGVYGCGAYMIYCVTNGKPMSKATRSLPRTELPRPSIAPCRLLEGTKPVLLVNAGR